MKTRSGPALKCSSCGRAQQEVIALINVTGFYICDRCVELCNEIIEEELGAAGRSWSWRRRDELPPTD